MQNKINQIYMPGGLIGLFMPQLKSLLTSDVVFESRQGWKLVTVIQNESGFFLKIISFLLLFITLFLYTIGSRYLVIYEYIGNSGENNSNISNSNANISQNIEKTEHQQSQPITEKQVTCIQCSSQLLLEGDDLKHPNFTCPVCVKNNLLYY